MNKDVNKKAGTISKDKSTRSIDSTKNTESTSQLVEGETKQNPESSNINSIKVPQNYNNYGQINISSSQSTYLLLEAMKNIKK